MRLAALAVSGLFVLSACGQENDAPATLEAEVVAPIAVAAADQLTEINGPVTGIGFWTHPNVAFSSLLIIAGENGVTSYNIEDGSEVSTIPSVSAVGAAVSYIGNGPRARGLLAYYDRDASAFSIFEIDNITRNFKPVTGDIAIRGNVRGFCFGRGVDADGPTLAVLQKGELTQYEFSLDNATLTASASAKETAPDDVVSCAIDGVDGSIFVARENGAVHRLGTDGPGELFAKSTIDAVGDIAVLSATNVAEDGFSYSGQVVVLDKTNATMHAFDRADGSLLGKITIGEAFEIEAVTGANVMGAVSANLGALYRNGAIALSLSDGDSAVRLIPANGLINALGLPDGDALSPRGIIAEPEESDLLIRTTIQPE